MYALSLQPRLPTTCYPSIASFLTLASYRSSSCFRGWGLSTKPRRGPNEYLFPQGSASAIPERGVRTNGRTTHPSHATILSSASKHRSDPPANSHPLPVWPCMLMRPKRGQNVLSKHRDENGSPTRRINSRLLERP